MRPTPKQAPRVLWDRGSDETVNFRPRRISDKFHLFRRHHVRRRRLLLRFRAGHPSESCTSTTTTRTLRDRCLLTGEDLEGVALLVRRDDLRMRKRELEKRVPRRRLR
jgi:hypothetical protein